MKRILLLSIISFLSFETSWAQCPVTATASASATAICSPGGNVTLTGTNTAAVVEEEFWTPTTGLTNPNSAVTTANVTVPTTYTYTVKACDNVNLVVNGDFESGNTGFTSWFTFSTFFIPIPGEYYITDDPSLFGFPNCADKTPGSGINMQMIDALDIQNQEAWCQTVAVNPTSDYKFSFWGLALVLGTTLEASVNGTPIGSTVIPAPLFGVCDWRKVSKTWINPGVSTAEICITNTTSSAFSFFPPSAASPIYALDEITFVELCEDTDNIFIDVITAMADIVKPSPVIDCTGNPVTLDGSGSTTGANISYSWTTSDGNIVGPDDNNTVDVDMAGTYTLTVTYDDGTTVCTDSKTVTITDTSVEAIVTAPPVMDCSGSVITIDGTGSTSGSNVTYLWTTSDGNIVGPDDNNTVDANMTGSYTLTVTYDDGTNICNDDETVIVIDPSVEAIVASPPIMNCSGSAITIDGGGSTTGTNISYLWTTPDGNIVGPDDNNIVDVDMAGTYTLTVTFDDGANVCTDDETVVVIDPSVEAIIATPPSIGCGGGTETINGSSSTSGSFVTYLWTTPDGNIVGPDDNNTVDVDMAGTYTLTVTYDDGTTVCTDDESVTISASGAEAIIVPPPTIDCNGTVITIDGSGSTSGSFITYLWTTPDGNIIGPDNNNTVDVDMAGSYTLTVTFDDGTTICTDVATTTVDDGQVEAIVIAPPAMNCAGSTLTIDGSGSTSGTEVSYLWTTPDGNIVGADDNNTVDVDMAGSYTLTVTYDDGTIVCNDDETIVVIDPSVEAIIATPPIMDCFGNMVTIDASGSTSGPFVSYLWTTTGGNIVGADDNNTVDVDMAGSYMLTVTYDDGTNFCVENATVTIINPSVEAIIATPPLLGCSGSTETLDGSGSTSGPFITYLWTTPDGNIIGPNDNNLVDFDMAGTYTLTVTYDDGTSFCVDDESVTISAGGAEAVISTIPTIGCNGGVETIDGSGSSSGPFITYLWTTADGNIVGPNDNNTVDIDMAGSYTLTVTFDDGTTFCTDDETVLVTDAQVEAIIAAPPLIDCFGSIISLDGSGSTSGSNISYQWTTPNGNIVGNASNSTVNIDEGGTYTLTVTYNDGSIICTDNESVTIIDPSVEAIISTPPSMDCFGNPLTIDGSGSTSGANITYLWTTPDGNIIGPNDNITVDVDMAGSYTLSVTYDDGTTICTDDETVIVNDAQVEAIVVTPPLMDCIGSIISLDGSGSTSGANINYQWTTSDGNIVGSISNSSVDIDMGGTYTLTVTYNDGSIICTDDESVTIIDPSVEAIVSTPPSIDCFGNPLTIDGSSSTSGSNITYQWTTSDGNIVGPNDNNFVDVNLAGSYTLTVTYDDGTTVCTDTESVTVIDPSVEAIIITPPVIDCDGNAITIDGSLSSNGTNITYLWATTNGNIVGADDNNTVDVDMAGSYTLTVTFDDGTTICTDTETIIVDAVDLEAIIQTPPSIDCNETPITIDGSNSSSGLNIFYQWTTVGGNIVGSSTGNTIMADKEGHYTLEVIYDDGVTFCSISESVLVSQIEIIVDIATPDLIDCDNNPITLDGTGSSFGSFIFWEWTTINGHIIGSTNGNTADVDMAGDYTLTVTYDDGTTICTKSETITVEEIEVEATIETPPYIDCDNTPIFLDGFNSSTGTGYFYEWTTPNGNIVGSNSNIDVEVNMSGDYTLTVTYDANGIFCQTSEVVTVEEIEIDAQILPPPLIDCDGNSIFLDGTGSSTGVGYEYKWTTTNGNILGSTINITAKIDEPGNYTLTVTYDDNGVFCEQSFSVLVEQVEIVVQIESPPELDCKNTPIIIDGSNSSIGPEYSYEWTTTSGNIIGSSDQLTAEVNVAADYFLTVTYDANGILCSKTERVSVKNSSVTAEIEDPDIIDCDGNPVILDGINSSSGPGISYQWTTVLGNIIGPTDGNTIDIDLPGEYILEVTLDINGTICVQSTSVEVEKIDLQIDIETPSLIDCFGNSIFLDGSNSSKGTYYFYEWTTPDGNIIGSTLESIAEVDQIGDYTLTITYDDGTNFCSDFKTVTVEKIDIDIDIKTPDFIDCDGNPVALDGSNSTSGIGYFYDWTTTNGNILSAFNSSEIMVNRPGIYTLTVFYDLNGVTCSKSEKIEVFNDPNRPTANILPPLSLSCKDSILTLDGSQSTQGSTISFEWTTPDGNILTPISADTASVNQTGIYQLLVTDSGNACKDSVGVTIVGNFDQPTIQVLTPDTLNCKKKTVFINAENSGANTDFQYDWEALSGNILTQNSAPNIEVDQAGNYQLILTENANGCKDTTEIEVAIDLDLPKVNILSPPVIKCDTDSIILDGTGTDFGTNYSIKWNSPNGNFLNNENSLNPVVYTNGTYWLTVENLDNGCIDSLSTLVQIDTIAPIVDGGLPIAFACNTDSVQLMATVSGNITNFLYQWSAISGNILSGQSSTSPFVQSAGVYMVFVIDTSNNCMAQDTAKVLADVDLPNVSIVATDTLTCNIDSIQLDATASDFGTNFDFNWTTIDGNFNSNPTDYQPFVTEPGTYGLSIENTLNGCKNLATITVIEALDTPQIFVPDPEIINCERTSVDILSFTSGQNGNNSFEWTTMNGSISGPVNSPAIKAESAGDYNLKVIDLNNGCESNIVVEVVENINTPNFQIIPPDTLNCINDEVDLDITINNNPSTNYLYEWTSVNGTIIGGINQSAARANLIGNYTLSIVDTVSKCRHLETIEVFENIDFPVVIIESQDSLDCGETRTLIAANSSQGNEFIYKWTTPDGVFVSGENTIMPVISSQGTYILEIENSINGCKSNDNITIFGENSISNIEIQLQGSDTLDCNTTNVIATANEGNYEYTWINTGQTPAGNWTNKVLLQNAGIVQVVLKDLDTDCEGSTTIEIFEDYEKPEFIFLKADSITCQDSLVNLEIQVTGNPSNFEFLWSTANGNFTINNDTPTAEVNQKGIYQIQVISLENGCTDSLEIEVFESNQVPTLSLLSSNQINCKYDSTVVSSLISNSSGNLQYNWTTLDGNIQSGFNSSEITVNQSGNYILEIIDNSTGCKTDDQISILEYYETPEISQIVTDTITCVRTEVVINAQILNLITPVFQWETTNGNIIGKSDTASIKVNEPGLYNFVITNLESFCEITGGVQVEENTTPPDIQILPSEPLTCFLKELQIDASQSSNGGHLSNRWSTDESGNIVSGANGLGPIVDQTGMYFLEITNIFNGCSAIDSTKVDSLPDDINGLILSETHPTCENNFGTIQIEDISGSYPPFEYSIDGGMTFTDNVLYESLPEGIYNIIVRDSIGCTESDFLEFIIPSPVEISTIPEINLSAGATKDLKVTVDIPIDQIATIEWFPSDNLSCSDCLNPTLSGITNNTSYLVRVTTVDNCFAEATIQVNFDGTPPRIIEEGVIFFPSVFSPNDDGVNDLFTGFSNASKVTKIETLQVFDRWGNKIYEGFNGLPNDSNFGWNGRYKNQRMNTGVYVFFAKVELANGETILIEGDITLAL